MTPVVASLFLDNLTHVYYTVQQDLLLQFKTFTFLAGILYLVLSK